MNYNIALVSLGCPKNLVDSEVMLKILNDNPKYNIVDKLDIADIVIINTCGFIESAKQESINTIIEIGNYKKTKKCKAIIAAGCLSERYNKELLNLLPELDAVIGTGDYKNINYIVNKVLQKEKVLLYGNQEKVDIDIMDRYIQTGSHTAYLKIAEGCDNKCTYCAIPFIRGKYRSRKFEKIIDDANELAKNGIKEVILIAQDTTMYGKDLYNQLKLPQLLKEIASVEGIEWIRLMYTYPDKFSDALINVIASEDKICKYLDIPIQHASNHMLKCMGRHISKGDIIDLIDKLRKKIPNIALRTSLIVGFPGESEEDFQELLNFIKVIKFDRLGVFTFSREEGTPAYKMKNQIEENEKIKRKEIIMETQMDISLNNNTKFIGKTLRVLTEGYENGNYFGRSYRDAPEIDGIVYFNSSKHINKGEFYDVLINNALEYDLIGEN